MGGEYSLTLQIFTMKVKKINVYNSQPVPALPDRSFYQPTPPGGHPIYTPPVSGLEKPPVADVDWMYAAGMKQPNGTAIQQPPPVERINSLPDRRYYASATNVPVYT